MNCVDLHTVCHELRLSSHLVCGINRFLIERILHELLLQPEVLELLLLFALTVEIISSVKYVKLASLFPLLMINRHIEEDALPRFNFQVVSVFFASKEFTSLLLDPLQSFIARVEALFIPLFVIIDRH